MSPAPSPDYIGPSPIPRCIALVACSSEKSTAPIRAADLYRGRVFRAASRVLQSGGPRWAILSALHGTVDPWTTLAPYDVTLRDLSRAERAAWAERAAEQALDYFGWRPLVGSAVPLELVVLAGELYCGAAAELARRLPGLRIVRPLAGLGIGQQYAALARLHVVLLHARCHAPGNQTRATMSAAWDLRLLGVHLPCPSWTPLAQSIAAALRQGAA